MTREDAEIDKASSAFFAFLGRYVFTLQWIEGMLEEIIRLSAGFGDQWNAKNDKLATMALAEKINAIKPLMTNEGVFRRAVALPDWGKRTNALVKNLHKVRKRRNELVHSQYLFDFLEIGGPVYRSNRIRRDGKTALEGEDLFEQSMDEELHALYLLGFEVSQYKLQLVHVHERPGR